MTDANPLSHYLDEPFKQKHLLTLQSYSKEEILRIIAFGLKLKGELKQGIPHPILDNKSLAMIFAKPSTRTRVSFEVGIRQLGGFPLFLSSAEIQLGRGEPISDTAKVLSRYVDGIMIRTFRQEDVEDLAHYSSVPVINGLTDLYHPCQALADILTIYEKKGKLSGLKLAYLGDGNNVAHSLMIACTKLGIDISIGCPPNYRPNLDVTQACQQYASLTGAKINITDDPYKAAEDADVLYTDVWASMGQESEKQERAKIFAPYQVNEKLFSKARPDASFLHCLPAYRGLEVTGEIIDGPHSLVFEQAENRLHAQKAVMALLIQRSEISVQSSETDMLQ